MKRLVWLQHVPVEGHGYIADWANGQGFTAQAVCLYAGDPLAQLIAEVLGARLSGGLEKLCQAYEIIGDVRGAGLYCMIDVVADKQSKRPDAEMAERIRYNAALEGLIFICVKNFMRFCPPLIITEDEIDAAVAGLEREIKNAVAGYPKNVDFRVSSSLATGRETMAP